MNWLRSMAAGVGLALLGATAHVTITATGGYMQPHAAMTLAIAAGVGVGALAIGSAWTNGRRALAGWLVAAIVAGEAFGFVSTAERLVAARETAQAPLRASVEAQQKAVQRVRKAEAAVAAQNETSARLSRAVTAKAAADAAAIEKAAERGCRENCRALLQAQVDQSGAEVAAARAEIEQLAARHRGELDAARTSLAALKPPASATPLADRLRVPPWAIDLLASALGSMAANGLAAGLLCFAGHGRHQEPATEAEAPAAKGRRRAATAEHATAERPSIEVAPPLLRFAVDHILPDERAGASTEVLAIASGFREWCEASKVSAPASADLGQALAQLFKEAGIRCEERHGRWVALGVRLKTRKAIAAPKRAARPDRQARPRQGLSA